MEWLRLVERMENNRIARRVYVGAFVGSCPDLIWKFYQRRKLRLMWERKKEKKVMRCSTLGT